jgi:hypothetical protein
VVEYEKENRKGKGVAFVRENAVTLIVRNPLVGRQPPTTRADDGHGCPVRTSRCPDTCLSGRHHSPLSPTPPPTPIDNSNDPGSLIQILTRDRY